MGEPLVEVSTDKVDIEIPSPAVGFPPEIAVGEDETAGIGHSGGIGRAATAAGPAAPAPLPRGPWLRWPTARAPRRDTCRAPSGSPPE